MATNSKVEATIKEIEEAYSLGKTLIEESPEELTHGFTASLAAKYGISEEKIRKLRVLANEDRGFSRAELDEQFNEFRLTGKCLSLSHFIRSLAINKKLARKKALQLALEKEMSSHAFQEFITSKQPNSRGAGRKPKAGKVKNFNKVLGGMVWSWNRELTAKMKVNRLTTPGLEEAVIKMKTMMELVILKSECLPEKTTKNNSSLFELG
jgi:hypothetical protein